MSVLVKADYMLSVLRLCNGFDFSSMPFGAAFDSRGNSRSGAWISVSICVAL